ncbi:MAG TPA: lytic transglycosylase domain-containing protein [Solirubrobacterales bacterium]|nr:lytic transglycosylase domain-containing protein [Solirubrobacterales bacterium]
MSAAEGGRGGTRLALLATRIAVRTLLGPKLALLAAPIVLPLLFFAGLFFASGSSAGDGPSCEVNSEASSSIPTEYVPWLQLATSRYRLGPRGFAILAAIHEVESDFGRSTEPGVRSGTNYAGAEGPGQFLASTWATYGVDADGDGVKDPYSVPDSVLATANYLRASGAPADWRAAIFEYNHAEWYVDEVLEKAAAFGSEVVCEAAGGAAIGGSPPRSTERMEAVARWIESRRIHYCWGGGHAPQPGPSPGSGEHCPSGTKGLDCSGAVRWLLVLSGYPDPGGLRSDLLGAAYPSGPGQQVTIWANIDHVFVTIDGRDWGTASANFADGPAFAPQFHGGFAPSHPPGL